MASVRYPRVSAPPADDLGDQMYGLIAGDRPIGIAHLGQQTSGDLQSQSIAVGEGVPAPQKVRRQLNVSPLQPVKRQVLVSRFGLGSRSASHRLGDQLPEWLCLATAHHERARCPIPKTASTTLE